MDFDSAFVWNSHLSRPLRVAIGETATARWVTPLVHGFFEMRRVSLLGTALDVVLLARRSRHFAGTRYRRRGVNASGRVANEVETEQIVDVVVEAVDDRGGVRGDKKNTPPPRVASAVQMRGSIPVFWSQEASVLEARPEIVLGNGRADDPNHAATAKHLDLVERRYGGVVWCGLVWFGVVWLVWCGLGWFGGLVWCGLVWFGVVWWVGLVWFGVVWWVGLVGMVW